MIGLSEDAIHHTPWGDVTNNSFHYKSIHDAVVERAPFAPNNEDCPICESVVHFEYGQFNAGPFRVCIPCALRLSYRALMVPGD